MCRSIKVLRNHESLATDAEIEAAALQFVRKISGYRTPSKANADAFNDAVAGVAETSRKLLTQLTSVSDTSRRTPPPPEGEETCTHARIYRQPSAV